MKEHMDRLAADIRALQELFTKEPKGPKEREELRLWAERNLEHMSAFEREIWKREAQRQK